MFPDTPLNLYTSAQQRWGLMSTSPIDVPFSTPGMKRNKCYSERWSCTVHIRTYIHIRMYMYVQGNSTLLSNLSGIATSSIIEMYMYKIMYIHVPQGCFVIGKNARVTQGVLDGGGFTDT